MRNVTNFQNAIISNASASEPVARALAILSGLVPASHVDTVALCETLERVAENVRVAHPAAWDIVDAPSVAGGDDFFFNAPPSAVRALAAHNLTRKRTLYDWVCDIECALTMLTQFDAKTLEANKLAAAACLVIAESSKSKTVTGDEFIEATSVAISWVHVAARELGDADAAIMVAAIAKRAARTGSTTGDAARALLARCEDATRRAALTAFAASVALDDARA